MMSMALTFLGIFTMMVAMSARQDRDAFRFFVIISILFWLSALWTITR